LTGTYAIHPAIRLVPPRVSAASNTWKDWDIDPVDLATGLQFAISTKFLPRPLGYLRMDGLLWDSVLAWAAVFQEFSIAHHL